MTQPGTADDGKRTPFEPEGDLLDWMGAEQNAKEWSDRGNYEPIRNLARCYLELLRACD